MDHPEGRTAAYQRARAWLCLLFCLSAAFPAHAPRAAVRHDDFKALTQYVHENWSTRDGLPNRRVTAIEQTRDGFLWVATQQGLARFDGLRFQAFTTETHPALGNNDIRALEVARDGALWIGTYGGGLVRLADGEFTRYTSADGLAHDVVYGLHEDSSGRLWIATAGGVSRFDGAAFANFTEADGLAANAVFAVHETRDGAVWMGTYGGGLSRFANGRFATFHADDGLGSDIVFALAEDDAGTLWIATYGGGLVRFRDGRFRRYTVEDGLPENRLVDLVSARNGDLWIATYDGGISRFRDGRFSNFTREHGLSDDLVVSIFEDRDGTLWAGTSRGLDRLHAGRLAPHSVWEGLPNDRVYAVHADAGGRLWIATEGGGLGVFDAGRLRTFTTADGLASDNIISLASAPDGSLWVGTVDAGASHYRDGTFTNYGTAAGLASDIVFAIAGDAAGNTWFGTAGGLSRLADGRMTTLDDTVGPVSVRALHAADDGSLWVGTNGRGLLRRLANGAFIQYGKADGLGGAYVFSLYEDADGTLWIGSKDGGLTRYRDGRFFAFHAAGLAGYAVNGIVEDNDGDLWLSTPGELLEIDKGQLNALADGLAATLDVRRYGESDGLRSAAFSGGSQPAATKTASGHLWFASDTGAVSVDPRDVPMPPPAVPVYIESVVVDETALDPAASVPADHHRVRFAFAAPALTAPGRIALRFRLAGFDRAWLDAGRRRNAEYTDLPPGDYEFQVEATGRDGGDVLARAALPLRVEAHLYQAAWFRAAVAAFVALLLIAIARLWVRGLRKRARVLAAMVDERTRELESANRQLTRMSMLDGLTNIPNRRRFDEKLHEEWLRSCRHGRPLSLVLVDVDDFKAFNDSYGHQVGDNCLREVAATLERALNRAGDLVARYGGEEFVVVLPETDAAGAVRVAERLCRRIERLAVAHPGSAAGVVTVSAGVASAAPAAGRSPETLLAEADRNLYAAKKAGRNCVRATAEPLESP